jgi:phage repressor protein C with HTH and peptisase S24 domain
MVTEAERFGKNLKKALVDRGMRQAALAKALGIGQETISQYINGETLPKVARRAKIATAVGVPLGELEGGSYAVNASLAKRFSAGYREIEREDLPADWQGRYVPVVGRLAAGGETTDTTEAGQYAVGDAATFVECHGAPAGAIAVRVAGDSMKPTYRPGDILVADPAVQVSAGPAVVVYEDPSGSRWARLKVVHREGKEWVLESTNPAWSPVRVPAKRIKRLCRIVRHLPLIMEA